MQQDALKNIYQNCQNAHGKYYSFFYLPTRISSGTLFQISPLED